MKVCNYSANLPFGELRSGLDLPFGEHPSEVQSPQRSSLGYGEASAFLAHAGMLLREGYVGNPDSGT